MNETLDEGDIVRLFNAVGQNEKLFSFNMSEMPAYEVIRRQADEQAEQAE